MMHETAETSREWDRTRYAEDMKKDNSSPAIRQRDRKALLGNMMRSERFFTMFDDCLAMQNAWKTSGRRFSIGYTLRYAPHYIKIHEI